MDTLRKSLDIEDDSPFADVAEGLLAAFAMEQGANVVADVYHSIVEAVVHPYNADAVQNLRDFVAQNREHRSRHGHAPKDDRIAQLCLDAEAALDHLGLQPSDYETEVKPHLRDAVQNMMKTAEDFVGQHVAETLKSAPAEVIYAGPGKLQN